MTREELEHIIRASGDVTDWYEFVIVGSQSMLGPVPHPESVFTVSMEADIYPFNTRERRVAEKISDQIDGTIGEGSKFHESHGYYAQGVGEDTATLPSNWKERVHRVQNRNTGDRVGYCLDVIDLFLSKAAARREKDREFCIALMEYGYVKAAAALDLVHLMPLDDDQKKVLRATIRRWERAVPGSEKEPSVDNSPSPPADPTRPRRASP